MGSGISVGFEFDCAKGLCTSNHSSLSAAPSSSSSSDKTTSSHTVHQKPRHRVMGDIFYGNDDHREMNDCLYKEDVMESMQIQRESKELKKKQSNFWNFRCFEFLKLLRAFINF